MWQKLAPIAEGGTVFNIEVSPTGQIWLTTSAGVLHRTTQGWQPIPQSRPWPSISALQAAKDKWWVAGLTGGLLRSLNGGQSWQACWLDQVIEPVTCLAVSPRYTTDYTLLAGTDGAGVLRSTDGGRRWLLSNFGLQNFTILTLVTATDWSRREIIFAGTLAGIYRSSGGGRAWKQAGLTDETILSLAVSPRFADNGLILAGSEEHGLYRSSDGGQSWQPVGDGLPSNASINTLLCHDDAQEEYWLAGAHDGYLWRSVDGGKSWTEVWRGITSVLALAAGPEALLAGLSEQGLLISTDNGESWSADLPLYGRGFQRLMTTTDAGLLAIAPMDGIWATSNDSQTWERSLEVSPDQPLFSLAVIDQTWLVAKYDGLWRCLGDETWQLVLAPTDAQIIAVAPTSAPQGGQPLWAAAVDCRLWRSLDEGLTWHLIEIPFAGQQLVTLAVIPEDTTVVLGSFTPQQQTLTLWRLDEDGWQAWLRQSLTWPNVQFAVGKGQTNESWLAIGKELWRNNREEWQKVTTFADGIGRIVPDPKGEILYVLAGQQIFYNDSAGDWTPLALPDPATQLIDIQVTDAGELLGLDVAGVLWRRKSSPIEGAD